MTQENTNGGVDNAAVMPCRALTLETSGRLLGPDSLARITPCLSNKAFESGAESQEANG